MLPPHMVALQIGQPCLSIEAKTELSEPSFINYEGGVEPSAPPSLVEAVHGFVQTTNVSTRTSLKQPP